MSRVSKNILIATFLGLLAWNSGDIMEFWPVGIVFGVAYGMMAEYCYHRFVLHSSHSYFGISHRKHHQKYKSGNLQVGVEDATEINEPSHIFVLAFACHWTAIDILFGSVSASFMLAVTFYYIWYELGHWACHVKNNPIDNFLLPIPYIGEVRRKQIDWHLEHHKSPKIKYNFAWPFIGDLLFNTGEEHERMQER